MSLDKAKEFRQKRAGLAKQAQDILNLADTEKRSLTTEEDQQWNALHTDIDKLTVDIDREERQAAANALAGNGEPQEHRGNPNDPENRGGEQPQRVVEREEYRQAFDAFVRYGLDYCAPEQRQLLVQNRQILGPGELRALAVGTGSAGGYTVPTGFYNRIMEAQKFFGGMRKARTTIISTASGNDLPIPTDDDTAQSGALLAENTATTEQDVTFGQITLKAYKFTSKIIRVSLEMLQDSAFDMESYLSRKFGMRIGRAENTYYTTGTGTAQPKGVVTGATLGKTGTTGQTLTVIYDDLVDLIHAVDIAYRDNAQFMFHDSTLKALKKLKDSQQRPLWLPGIAIREPDTINGYQFVVNNDIAVMAANAKSILFGDFANYFIRDVMDITVLRLVERYADYGQVGFLAFARHDGNLIDAGQHPIAYYANSAT